MREAGTFFQWEGRWPVQCGVAGVSDANPDGRLQEKPGFREKSDGMDELCDGKTKIKAGVFSDRFS